MIPRDLWLKARSLAVGQGKSMSAWLTDAIQAQVVKQEQINLIKLLPKR